MQKLPAFLTLSLLMASIPASSQTLPEGVERIQIPVGDMVFDALAAGPEYGELVLLLHGFPQSSYSYRTQLPVLAAQGFRAVAPDQRGYSAGARPTEVSAYAMGNLVGDVLDPDPEPAAPGMAELAKLGDDRRGDGRRDRKPDAHAAA